MDSLLLVTPRLLDGSKPSVAPVRIAITDETTPDELKEQISEEFGLGSFPVKLHSLCQFEGDKEEWVAVSAPGLLRMMLAYASTGELSSHLKLGPGGAVEVHLVLPGQQEQQQQRQQGGGSGSAASSAGAATGTTSSAGASAAAEQQKQQGKRKGKQPMQPWMADTQAAIALLGMRESSAKLILVSQVVDPSPDIRKCGW
jgi:F0F1-type ATP synthase membrane subunit c/vacuolar-type H+-ATPase subunit K